MQKDRKTLLQFPCVFPLKVMGPKHPEFQNTIGALVQTIVTDFDPNTISCRDSRAGNYQALAITVYAQSREQLDNLYRALTSHPMVKVVF